MFSELTSLNDIFIDSKNRLIWEDKKFDKTTYTWEESQHYCKNLVINNFTTWRTPTISELRTIYTAPLVFNNIPSTEDGYKSGYYFYWSSLGHHLLNVTGKKFYNSEDNSEKHNVRCVVSY